MKVVVGIGNPGRKYRGTRHNVGFEVLDAAARAEGAAFRESEGPAETAAARLGDDRVVLVKPLTYVNLTGTVLAPVFRSFGRPDGEDGLLVVCDYLNLPLGRLRIRGKGSAGGHNGLKSVIEHWGSDAFARLRVGVGAPRPGEAVDHVLGRFDAGERDAADAAVSRAAEAVGVWLREGLAAAMNRFNAPDKESE